MLELFELEADEGPCVDCYRTGQPILNLELSQPIGTGPGLPPEPLTPSFGPSTRCPCASEAGPSERSTCFGPTPTDPGRRTTYSPPRPWPTWRPSPSYSTKIPSTPRPSTVSSIRRSAVASIIEQAKGKVSQGSNLDMDQAFRRLRQHARNHNLRLGDLAADVVNGVVSATSLDPLPDPR